MHEDAEFKNFFREHYGSKGWYWEPQAPQMLHMNFLDMSVFPETPRRHIKRARARGGLGVLREDDIWEVVMEVWK